MEIDCSRFSLGEDTTGVTLAICGFPSPVWADKPSPDMEEKSWAFLKMINSSFLDNDLYLGFVHIFKKLTREKCLKLPGSLTVRFYRRQ